MKKRIIICLDGTWNVPSYRTNIHWISDNIETTIAEPMVQIVRYVRGIGTAMLADQTKDIDSRVEAFSAIVKAFEQPREKEYLLHTLLRKHDDLSERWLGGPFGIGLERQIREGYEFIQQEWRPGDETFIFGFSRGAYTARVLANFIGVAGKLDPDDAKYYKIFKVLYLKESIPDYETEYALNDVKDNAPIDITFLGIFDTVGALGLPGVELIDDKYDMRIGTHIDNVYHAVSIDETLKPFKIQLLDSIDRSHTNAEEVWFAGGHGDVGGGHPLQRSGPILAKVPLFWMMKAAEKAGLILQPNSMTELEKDANPMAPQSQHNTPPNVPDNPSDGPHKEARKIPTDAIVHEAVKHRRGVNIEVRNSKGEHVENKIYEPENLSWLPLER